MTNKQENLKICAAFSMLFFGAIKGENVTENRTMPITDLPVRYRPIKYFSLKKGSLFTMQKHTVTGYLGPCLEDDAVYLYVTEGRGTVFINGVTCPVRKHSFLILHSYHVFSIRSDPEQSLSFTACTLSYAICSFLNIHPWFKKNIFDLPAVIRLQKKDQEEIAELLELIEEESFFGDDQSNGLILLALLGQLLTLLLRLQGNLLGREKEKPLCGEILKFVTQNCRQDLSLSKTAEHFKTKKRVISRELRKLTCCNFRQLLQRARVILAFSCLSFPGIPIRFLAYFSGFKADNSFYSAFKSYYGMNPSYYRRKIFQSNQDICVNFVEEPVIKLLHYIITNFRKDLTLQKTAAALYTNENWIKKTLLDYSGYSLSGLLNSMRLCYARSLLLTSQMQVRDISEESGFNSIHTFYRLFKRSYGKPPGQYRQDALRGGNHEGGKLR